jgi:hypothetical protein
MATHDAARAVALSEVAWHVSSRSGNGDGNCVEAGPVLDGSGRVAVRDSKDRAGDVLVYAGPGWASFLTALKHGGLTPTP